MRRVARQAKPARDVRRRRGIGPAGLRRAANAPITAFSGCPSTDQAGGHPDVEVHFAVENRLSYSTARAPATARTPKTRSSTSRRVHRQPPRNAAVLDRRLLRRRMPDRLPDRNRRIVNATAMGSRSTPRSTTSSLRPTSPAWLAFKIFLFDTPQFTMLSARTGSDYGLDADGDLDLPRPGLSARGASRRSSGGFRPIRSTTRCGSTQRSNPSIPGEPPSYDGELCDANGAPAPTTRTRSSSRATRTSSPRPITRTARSIPFLQNPTTCDGPLEASRSTSSPTTAAPTTPTAAWPQQTGCDQLSFNPSLYAQPTTTETDSASGIDVNLSVPQQLSPTIPSPTELRAATVTLPAGFSINPNAADGKTSCTDAEANFGTADAAHCPEFAKVGSLDDRQLRPAGPDPRLRLPRRAAARQSLPDLPRRRRLRHPRQAGGHGHPRSR